MITSIHRWVWLVLMPLVVLAGCKASGPGEVEGQALEPAVVVRTSAVTAGGDIAPVLRFSGIVQATQRATLTFQVSGTLKEQRVELGQQVARGEVLARVYNPALEPARDSAAARLQELDTQLVQANREWERSRQLYERGVVSEQALEQLASRRDSLQASLGTARAALAEASRLLDESRLLAPFDGRVEALLVEKDEFVGAGQPVVRLSSPQGREVEVRVPAYMLGFVSVGQSLPIWSVHNRAEAPVTGTVMEVAQASAVRGELHQVLVQLPDDTLAAGQPVEVGLAPPMDSVTMVPLLSVIRGVSGESVYRVRDQHAERVSVSVRRIVGDNVVVESPALAAGDQVVYAGLTRLVDGDRVEILP
ncbi:efflux RND transporter periplasmic adaptor subunit [Marinobacter zhejiangensis]|uniref:RND family efflux transporter, MFP subunit n=1 Tax=Marinobacter zhejiangensis TaxID=488535 RepID=A0A1I4KST4_9GAMM|nr:efflux RND transporter periplasmic adaptor subunit [Marinobacter zhejiangensis]SFL81683.1 RND family efflux transporter, MFP subunit [Marinobacter zhejiangensis]